MRSEFLRGIEGPPKNIPETQNGPIDKNVPGFRDLAKKALAEGEEEITEDLEQRIALTAQVRGTNPESQRTIFDLQVEKQKIMAELKRDLDQLKEPQTYGRLEKKEVKIPTIKYDATEQRFYRPGKNPVSVTLGEIMTSGEWGLAFYLDETVPLTIRKQYLLQEAKRKIGNLLDQQIIQDESASRLTDTLKQEAYKAMGQEREPGKETLRAGVLAEKMVRNYLESLTFDYPVSFAIRKADAHDDVEGKIDFIVEAQHHNRGVHVAKEQTNIERTGIQFTINSSPNTLAHKEQQAAKALRKSDRIVDDIVVVQISLHSVNRLHEEWKGLGKPVGGPEKRWDLQTKEQIFTGVMRGVLSPEEMQEQQQRIYHPVSAS